MFQKTRSKLGAKLIAWHLLSLGTPVVLSVSVFGLALYAQPMPTHTPVHSQTAAGTTNIIHHASAAPKAAAPPPPAPKAASPPPSSPPPAPARTPAAGTPKAEPVVTPSPSSSVSGLAPATPAPPSGSPAPGPPVTTGYTSTNWSGYMAVHGIFTAVSGSWMATNPTGNSSTITADSTWIGIGGVTSGDLIQVGTQNIISASGQVSASAFYELLPNVSQPVPGVSISLGDSMTASISQVSSGQWSISITDRTNGQSATFTVAYASSLSSAEWIEEDPSFSSRRQIPFDNFHLASFTGGSTVANGVNLTIAASTAQPVTMVNSVGQSIAIPSVIGSDGASFTVAP